VPPRTLSRWFNGEQNPPPDQLVIEKRAELKDLLDAEIRALFAEMPKARPDATYRDMGTVAGILMDKHLLLDGKATERKELTGKDGGAIETKVTLLSELSDDDLDRIIDGQPPTG
jgi:hypothetical protein